MRSPTGFLSNRALSRVMLSTWNIELDRVEFCIFLTVFFCFYFRNCRHRFYTGRIDVMGKDYKKTIHDICDLFPVLALPEEG